MMRSGQATGSTYFRGPTLTGSEVSRIADRAVVEATLAYAIGAIGGGKPALALAELGRLRPKLLEKKDLPEIDYWTARALEARDPRQSVATRRRASAGMNALARTAIHQGRPRRC